jgi:hypothetical protein
LPPDPPRRDQLALHGTCTSDARGICTLHGVAPGDYHAFAVPKEAGLDFRDPESIKALEKQAKAVKVAEGERQSVKVEVAPDDQ